MMRWFTPLLVFLVLAGCNNLRMLKMVKVPTSDETELFAQGLDQYIESRDLTTLKLLPQQYPQGEWRTSAEGIIGIAEQTEFFAQGLDLYIESRDLRILKLLPLQYPQGEWRMSAEGIIGIAEQKQQQQDQLEKKTRELTHSQQEKEFLFKDNKILEVTLERLKQVMFDIELWAE